MWVYLLKKFKNILAKEEIACFEQFLLLSKCFQKSSAAEASESLCKWEKLVKREIKCSYSLEGWMFLRGIYLSLHVDLNSMLTGQDDNLTYRLCQPTAISDVQMQFNPFPTCRRFSDEASAGDGFWKHCDKSRNCSKRAIFLSFCHKVSNSF